MQMKATAQASPPFDADPYVRVRVDVEMPDGERRSAELMLAQEMGGESWELLGGFLYYAARRLMRNPKARRGPS